MTTPKVTLMIKRVFSQCWHSPDQKSLLCGQGQHTFLQDWQEVKLNDVCDFALFYTTKFLVDGTSLNGSKATCSCYKRDLQDRLDLNPDIVSSTGEVSLGTISRVTRLFQDERLKKTYHIQGSGEEDPPFARKVSRNVYAPPLSF